ncbi:hypothetical protein SLEP1_g15458 [Rubroshorea leprosula]|uniref:Glutamate receptor n=1 Tax=Rubroshorea leprosula TaxID=152421 RepID=A0AAV5IWU4_9ROSI|nr:hypothetical protein SLEP1_g15458 [Rubroshorea leprosula]
MGLVPITPSISFSCLFIVLLRLFLVKVEVAVAQNNTDATTIPVNVGMVLDFDGWTGKLGLSCFNMALSDFYSNHRDYRTRLVLNTRDSKGDVVGAAAATLDLIKNAQVQAIIGPEDSMQAIFIIDVGNKAQVPIISFTATSPSLSSIRRPYFFRATHNDSSQVKAISAIIQAFGWREAVPIYVDNEFGEGVIPYLFDALEEINVRIPYRSVISPEATDQEIEEELHKLTTKQTRVFIVHMTPILGSRLFDIAKEVGLISEGYVWIMTNGMTNLWSWMDHSDMESLQGVIGVRHYVPKSKELESFKVRWKRKFLQNNPSMVNAELDIFGLWSYDAAFALAMAVEKLNNANFSFEESKGVGNARTDLESLGISQNGPKLIQALSSTRFKGLSGKFEFVNGQLEPSVFQIVNVIGNGEKAIGFWTSKYGLVKKLNFTNLTEYSTSRANLGTIMWPGDSHSVPKCKRLKIGVPVRKEFKEFVSVPPGSSPNSRVNPTGYSIDVFEAVMKAMPYSVHYDFYAFAKTNGEAAGTYNDLIDQVFYGDDILLLSGSNYSEQNYDAAVGDISIIANRSLYVDFTLPYIESDVVMVVPIKNNSNKNALVFLEPLTGDLWVTSSCFFVFIGFVIWVLEHRISEDFRGPPSHQVGTSLWFSFAILVFAHRETVVSNLSRFVVIIWCFVVLILTQSYTASLTSLLTVKQLQPTVTDVNELLKTGENVAYKNGSYIREFIQQLNFNSANVKTYDTSDVLDELFNRGSANGGIAAAFGETPYVNLLLEKYCMKYTTAGPTINTGGFGFVFPKGSPLVADVSRAILNVTESDKMREIEYKWFKKHCTDSSTLVSSNRLGLGSFWGLFLIAGVAAALALTIFVADFLYKQRDVLCGSEVSAWKRFLQVLRNFDQKDPSSHTFRQSELTEGRRIDNIEMMVAVEASPNTNCLHCASNSNQTDLSSVFFGEQGRPSTSHEVEDTSSIPSP